MIAKGQDDLRTRAPGDESGRPRRLAILCYHTSPTVQPGGQDAGGMNVYVREAARACAQRGYLVDIFTRAAGRLPAREVLSPGVRLVRIAAGPPRAVAKQRLVEFVPAFAQGVAAFRLAEGLRYDLLHSHYWLSGLAGLQLQRRWDVPHLTMFHTLGEVKNRARLGERESAERIEGERSVVRGVDRIICATEHERGLLSAHYGADPAAMTTIPCGVDTTLFRPVDAVATEAMRRRLALAGERALVYVGRVEPLKGLDVVIDAIAQLDAPRPLLLVVGGDSHAAAELRRLRERAQRAGVADRLRFAGAVPQQDLAAIYSLADVCVVPSYYESFGMAALEAQACGTPVVASRVGGLPSAIHDGETGFLVPWRCPQPFAEQLDLLLRNNGLRRRFGESARAWAVRFAWPAIADALTAEYQRLLDDRREAEDCHAVAPAGSKSGHVRCDVA